MFLSVEFSETGRGRSTGKAVAQSRSWTQPPLPDRKGTRRVSRLTVRLPIVAFSALIVVPTRCRGDSWHLEVRPVRKGLRQGLHGPLRGALRPGLEPSVGDEEAGRCAAEGSVASADSLGVICGFDVVRVIRRGIAVGGFRSSGRTVPFPV